MEEKVKQIAGLFKPIRKIDSLERAIEWNDELLGYLKSILNNSPKGSLLETMFGEVMSELQTRLSQSLLLIDKYLLELKAADFETVTECEGTWDWFAVKCDGIYLFSLRNGSGDESYGNEYQIRHNICSFEVADSIARKLGY
jgi:hypothetical protein